MRRSIITLGVIVVVFFSLLILLTSRIDQSEFEHSAHDMHVLIRDVDYVILPGELEEKRDHKLIDLRDPGRFAFHHLDGAINVPMASILEKKFQGLFSLDTPKVILAHDPIHAHTAWMLLTQLGYKNLFVMKP